jgi:membrane-associated phospholipid phosphatase
VSAETDHRESEPDDPEEARAGLDPSVMAAPYERWRGWARQIWRYEQQRLAGFGGLVAIGFIGGVIVMYLFAWLASEVLEQETKALDDSMRATLHQLSSPQMTAAMRAMSFMGFEAIGFLAPLLVVLFAWRRRWGAVVLLILIAGGAQLLNSVLKDVFQRARPLPVSTLIAAQQFSFPSGHAMVSAAFYSCLAYLAWRLVDGVWRSVIVAGLLLLVLLIGVSRIYLDAHYLSDVLAGYLVGLLWADVVILSSRMLRPRTLSR